MWKEIAEKFELNATSSRVEQSREEQRISEWR